MKKEYSDGGVYVFLTHEELHIINRALSEAAALHASWAEMYESFNDAASKKWAEHHRNEREAMRKIYFEL